jgi:hypothetical protein
MFGIEANYAGFFTPGLHPGMICGAPLGRGNNWDTRTQGCTLGWYAAPRWGAKTNRSSMSGGIPDWPASPRLGTKMNGILILGAPGLAGFTTFCRENDRYFYPGGHLR